VNLFAWKVMTAMTRSIALSSRQSVRSRRGFTLTEVLLVLAILGVIAAMVVPNLLGRQREAMVKTTKMSIKSFADAAEQYAVAHDGEYPPGGANEVIGILTNPGADRDGKPISPYLKDAPKDAWGELLHYEYPPTSKAPNLLGPAIWSSGPDKKSDDGGNDDVANWK
jgi:general secretion pathway protein G